MIDSMFKFLRRSGASETKPKTTPTVTATPLAPPMVNEPSKEFKERRLVARPLPVTDVVEGNGGETDWAMFEGIKHEATQRDKS